MSNLLRAPGAWVRQKMARRKKRLRLVLEDRDVTDYPPYYVGERRRVATATWVRLLGSNRLLCGSLVGRKIYAVDFERRPTRGRIVHSIDTTYQGKAVDGDLADVDPHGNIIVSNFHQGTCTHYRHTNGTLSWVRDLDLGIDGFVHGVKFLDAQVFAATCARGPTGIHFFRFCDAAPILSIRTDRKVQDVCFTGPQSLVAIISHGAPTPAPHASYANELHAIDFDLQKGTHQTMRRARFEAVHFDSCLHHAPNVYVTDQYNNCVNIVDAKTLRLKTRLDGFDFPHGVALGHGMLAVTNYGSNAIDLLAWPA